MNKRVNYMELLKESVADRGHDTTKSVDMKGPFLDPILGYDGGGELPTYKDASSILERYYFKENSDPGIDVSESEIGGGDTPDQDPAAKFHEPSGMDNDTDVDEAKKKAAKATELDESDVVENAVLERLIAEMEEDEELLEGEEPDQDPAAKFHEPSGDPDEDHEGLIDGDDHDGGEDAVKAATFPAGSDGVGKGIKAAMKEDYDLDLDGFNELLEMEEEITAGGKETPDEDDDKDDEDTDFDKEIKKESGAPIRNPHTADELIEEAFDIFREAIEDDEDDDLEDDEDDDDDDDKKK